METIIIIKAIVFVGFCILLVIYQSKEEITLLRMIYLKWYFVEIVVYIKNYAILIYLILESLIEPIVRRDYRILLNFIILFVISIFVIISLLYLSNNLL